MKCKIKLNSIKDVKEFVNVSFQAVHDVDLVCGKYHIDGKSIMGIFSLELDKPIDLEMDERDAKILEKQLEQFIVK